MNSNTPLLSCHAIHCRYGDRNVLNDVNLTVEKGEVVALLGPNGVGKTTLIHILAQLIRPNRGKVLVHGENVSNWDRMRLARHVTLMPQNEIPPKRMSVYDVVALGRTPHRGWYRRFSTVDYEQIECALSAVGMSELKLRMAETLSGGEWRRTALARSLAQQADLLMLDEPTAGLDLKFQWECLENVRSIAKKRDIGVLISLHDLNHAVQVADRVALLSCGAPILTGSVEQVLTPENIYESFGVQTSMVRHPVSNRPVFIPHPH